MGNQSHEIHSLLPALLGESPFVLDPIVDAEQFADRAGDIFKHDPNLSQNFKTQILQEMRNKQAMDFSAHFARKPLTAFAAGALYQAYANFKYAFGSNNPDYRYDHFVHHAPPVSQENYTALMSLSQLYPLIDQDRMLFRRLRIPQKKGQDQRIVIGTNPSEDIVMVHTTATIPHTSKENAASSPEKLIWVERYAAYRYTPEGITSLGDPLTLVMLQYEDVDYMISDIDFNLLFLPEQLKEHIIIPKSMLLKK